MDKEHILAALHLDSEDDTLSINYNAKKKVVNTGENSFIDIHEKRRIGISDYYRNMKKTKSNIRKDVVI